MKVSLVQKVFDATGGSCDIWRLAGPASSKLRAAIMSEACGMKVPHAKSGVNALRAKLYELAGVQGHASASSTQTAFWRYCRAKLGLKDYPNERIPAYIQLYMSASPEDKAYYAEVLAEREGYLLEAEENCA